MMMRASRLFIAVTASFVAIAAASWAKPPAAMQSSKQMIVVTTPNWDAVSGTLQRFERKNDNKKWQALGQPIAVVVAKNGLGWGAGVAGESDFAARSANDPVKHEGDSRAPAGLFRVGTAFGYAAQQTAGWKMPYVSLTPTVECVDDTSSKYYN